VGAVGIGACYGAVAYLLRGPLKIDCELHRRSDVLKYISVTMSGAALATLTGTLCLVGDHTISWNEFYTSGLLWFLGDIIAVLSVAPFLLICVFPWIRTRLSLSSPYFLTQQESSGHTPIEFGEFLETLAQAGTLAFVVWIMFVRSSGPFHYFYLSFIPIIWIAMRRGIRGAVIGVLAVNAAIVIAMRSFPPSIELLGASGLLRMVISATGLLVGAEVTERNRTAADLNQQTTYLKSLLHSSPLGIIAVDRQGQLEFVNPAFERLLLSTGKDSDYIESYRTTPGAFDLVKSCELIHDVFGGHAVQKTVRQQRTDGTPVDLAVHAVPLVFDGVVRGAYMICQDISEQVRASEAERCYSQSLSQLVAELKMRAHELAMLNEMRDLFECCTTPVEACHVAAESVQKLFPQARSGSLYVIPASSEFAEAVARWGNMSSSEALLTFDSCWCLRRVQAHWSEHSSGIRCGHLEKATPGASLCVPLVAQGHTLGVLHLEFGTDLLPTSAATSEDPRRSLQLLATSVAGQTAIALSGLNLRHRLQEQSIRDPLTELFNRRFMDETLEREMLRATRNSRPLAIIFVDIDHFKRINDEFGHAAGDHVLKSIADLLRTFFRACDVCCRFGGEEFAIILPDSSLQNAVVRANALRTEVKRFNMSHDSRSLGSITVSLGVAAFPENGSDPAELLKTADRCLYQSKAAGRDVVTSAAVPGASLSTQLSSLV
jgi:diguanylate cyclase (GGDEF)-like protein/PAS domain S-box-containing protein